MFFKIPLSLIFLITISRAPSNPCTNPSPHPVDKFIPQLLTVESSGSHYDKNGDVKISQSGAIGKWQVLPETALFFNSKNGLDYPVQSLYDETTNEIIGKWFLRYCYDISKGNIVLTFNRYHQGQNSSRYRIRHSYVGRIVPDKYSRFIGNKVIVSKDELYTVWKR